MAKYKYSQDIWLVNSGEKTRIKSVIENYSNKKVTYLLDNGMSVTDNDITDIEPQKPKRKKKYVAPVVEEVKYEAIEDIKESEKED